MSTLTGISYTDYYNYGGVSGTATQVDAALQGAWDQMELYLGTYLTPTVITDEMHLWPTNGILALEKFRLSSVEAITSRHDNANCDCTTEDFSGCSIVVDKKHSIINVRDCNTSCNPCTGSGGARLLALVDYTAGFSSLPLPVKVAIIRLASEEVAQFVGEREIGAPGIVAWKSMSYSESRVRPRETPFGTSYVGMDAANKARPYRVNRAIAATKVRAPIGL